MATEDIDAVPKGITADELGDLVKVALKLNLAGDWLNPWFASFTHVLPSDFEIDCDLFIRDLSLRF